MVKKLRRRRVDDDREVMLSYLPEAISLAHDDPAESDPAMREKLEESSKRAREQEADVRLSEVCP